MLFMHISGSATCIEDIYCCEFAVDLVCNNVVNVNLVRATYA